MHSNFIVCFLGFVAGICLRGSLLDIIGGDNFLHNDIASDYKISYGMDYLPLGRGSLVVDKHCLPLFQSYFYLSWISSQGENCMHCLFMVGSCSKHSFFDVKCKW